MGVVDRFNKTLRALEASINPTIKETIDRNKPLLIDEQTNTQWYSKGQDAEGKALVPSYALSTTIIKKKKGQPTNRVTLRDTGDLYNSIKIDTTTTEMIISANVEYFKYLVAHYDSNIILGLQRPFLEKFVEVGILPNLKRTWTNIIRE